MWTASKTAHPQGSDLCGESSTGQFHRWRERAAQQRTAKEHIEKLLQENDEQQRTAEQIEKLLHETRATGITIREACRAVSHHLSALEQTLLITLKIQEIHGY
jgi:hypothetical protein